MILRSSNKSKKHDGFLLSQHVPVKKIQKACCSEKHQEKHDDLQLLGGPDELGNSGNFHVVISGQYILHNYSP